MDLLAPILAYLGTVTALIAAVAMSYDAFVYSPTHSGGPPVSVALAAVPHGVKPAARIAAKTTRTGAQASRPLLDAASRPNGAKTAQPFIRRTMRTAQVPRSPRRPLEARATPRAYPLPLVPQPYTLSYAQTPFGFSDDPFR